MTNKNWHYSKERFDLEKAKEVALDLLSNGLQVKFDDLAKSSSSDEDSITCIICIANDNAIIDSKSKYMDIF